MSLPGGVFPTPFPVCHLEDESGPGVNLRGRARWWSTLALVLAALLLEALKAHKCKFLQFI